MDIKTLKSNILNNNLNIKLLILNWHDFITIPLQYINRIAETRDAEITYSESLDRCVDGFNFDDTSLKVVITDELKEDDYKKNLNNLDYFKNTIVVCKDYYKEFEQFVVDIPKIESTYITQYIRAVCAGLTDKQIEYLTKLTNNDLYRIDNELNKLKLFSTCEQSSMFDMLIKESNFSDLQVTTTYNIVNSIVNKDFNNIDLSMNISSSDIWYLCKLLCDNYMRILELKTAHVTAKELKMSDKQFNFIKFVQGNKYNEKELIRNIDFLLSIDYTIKSGQFDIDSHNMLDYIICKLIGGK